MEKSNLNNLMNRIQKDRDEMAFSEIFDFFAPKIANSNKERLSNLFKFLFLRSWEFFFAGIKAIIFNFFLSIREVI